MGLLIGTLGVAALHACGPVVNLFDELGKGEDESRTKTCRKVYDCGHMWSVEECEGELADLIEDGRITQERAVSCAVCMDDNSCDEIVTRRHCDVACTSIALVENLRTLKATRSNLCASIMGACARRELGMPAPSVETPGDCTKGLNATLRSTPSVDAEVASCAACVAETDAQRAQPSTQTERCEHFIALCKTDCAGVPTVRAVLADAEASFAVARAVMRLCSAQNACGDDPECASDIVAVLSAPDAGSVAVEQAIACGACLEANPCDSPTRDADCAAACAAFTP